MKCFCVATRDLLQAAARTTPPVVKWLPDNAHWKQWNGMTDTACGVLRSRGTTGIHDSRARPRRWIPQGRKRASERASQLVREPAQSFCFWAGAGLSLLGVWLPEFAPACSQSSQCKSSHAANQRIDWFSARLVAVDWNDAHVETSSVQGRVRACVVSVVDLLRETYGWLAI